MPTRKKQDLNELAASIVAQTTGSAPKTKMATPKQLAGREGGRKGGRSRMDALTADQRRELALKGVEARKAPAGPDTAGAVKVTKSGI